ncbi:MAG: ABC transporter ATP-binding protein, partial [Solobacterium sp.]|nr:ABC transporter ATP-binding protein [Solobacterium sp.]
MLELRDIRKTYYTGKVATEALKGISIRFRRNEFVSILGPSGCGKTTLLNIIGGLDQYTDGDLLIEGVSTKKYRDPDWDTYRNYRVGFIFQSYNLIMHQSVLANVEMALTLSGVSRSERKKRAAEALRKVGLGDQINKKPNQLSGGQMQRVSIARALVNDPEIILADEPTGALDSVTSIQIMDLLKEIAGDKLVVMVTHNPDIARDYSTRIVELKDGMLIGDSNPYTEDEVFTEQRVTGRTSMSFLTSLALSFRNLLTKKGRTLLTAFAGSIGIIGIALVLSLSNGVNNMTKELERDALSDYPITVEKTSFDLLGIFSTISEGSKENACEAGKICTRDDLVKATVISDDGLIKKNDLRSLKAYIESSEDFTKYTDEIDYAYNLKLQVFETDGTRVNPTTFKAEDEADLFKELPASKER